MPVPGACNNQPLLHAKAELGDLLRSLEQPSAVLHYKVSGKPARVRLFAMTAEGATGAEAEISLDDFCASLGGADAAARFGWHQSANAGVSDTASFSYGIQRDGNAPLLIDERAWRVADSSDAGETHGIIYARRSAIEPHPANEPAAPIIPPGLSLGVAFQPVVDANSGQTGFHECLARLLSEDGTPLDAGDFMPAILAVGGAAPIDRKVLARALEVLADEPMTRLSVNLHPGTVGDAEWQEIYDDAARQDAGLTERLIVEITEQGVLANRAETFAFMDHLRYHGTALALDDFGEGYTSFAQLRDFRFDIVKIAGSFVSDIVTNPDNRFFVETLVGIARHFEMMTVAEYVQSAAAARLLTQIGVDCFQGFYFGRPSLVLEQDKTARQTSAEAG